jgi:hypothetical protein
VLSLVWCPPGWCCGKFYLVPDVLAIATVGEGSWVDRPDRSEGLGLRLTVLRNR